MKTPIPELICWTLYVYGFTLLLTNAHIFRFWRYTLMRWRKSFGSEYEVETCRMCQGMWVTLMLLALGAFTPLEAGAVYGLSYFLATQER